VQKAEKVISEKDFEYVSFSLLGLQRDLNYPFLLNYLREEGQAGDLSL